MNYTIITNEAISIIMFWILLGLALWGMVDIANRLSFWAEKIIKRIIDRIRNVNFQVELPDIKP